MNTRSFLMSLAAVICTPWSAFKTRKGYKPILEQVFPKTLEELPGLFCHHVRGEQVFPYEIVREYDAFTDLWEGQRLYNPRRNKWWAKDVSGKTVLVYTGAYFNDPQTMFFKRV